MNENSQQLEEKIKTYAAAVQMLKTTYASVQKLKEQDALSILLARDELQYLLGQNCQLSADQTLEISNLDNVLFDRQNIILKSVNVNRLRKVLIPPNHHWWWFIQAQHEIVTVEEWDQFDWVFNLLSLAFLAGFASLTAQVIPMIFSGGVGMLESVGLMGPGALLTVVGSNIKGGESRDKFLKNMEKVGVPSKYCSEVTCLLAAVLFGGVYVARQVLPSYYFNSLVTEGIALYKDSRLILAKEKLAAALKLPDLDPKEVGKVFNYVGLIEESVGNDKDAIEAYDRAILLENKYSINNISRVYITKGDLLTAETYLKLGLQRTIGNEESKDAELQYNLHRNLGWVYLEAKRYQEAEAELRTALKISDQYLLNKDFFGQGMASCFLASIYDKTNRSTESATIWKNCRTLAKPETIAEYRTLVKLNPLLASEIDTKGLF